MAIELYKVGGDSSKTFGEITGERTGFFDHETFVGSFVNSLFDQRFDLLDSIWMMVSLLTLNHQESVF